MGFFCRVSWTDPASLIIGFKWNMDARSSFDLKVAFSVGIASIRKETLVP